GFHHELAARGPEETGEEAQQRALAGAVAARDQQEAAARKIDVDPAEHVLLAKALLETACADHVTTSASTKAKKPRLMTPSIVKNAVSSRRQSRGDTSACSYTSMHATNATPNQ